MLAPVKFKLSIVIKKYIGAYIDNVDKKKINIVLPGVLNFYEDTVFVGEQIMINLPRGGNDLDKVTSGPFVVLEVKHKFSENKYSQAMTCSKLTNSTDKTLAVGPTGYTNI